MRHVGIVSFLVGLAFASSALAAGIDGRWNCRSGASTVAYSPSRKGLEVSWIPNLIYRQ
jgi:hypothetical protein